MDKASKLYSAPYIQEPDSLRAIKLMSAAAELAQVTGFKPGELVHVIADAHIYDRHIPIVKELITRPTHPAPKFYMNPDVKDFYDFTLDDFRIEDYETGPQIKNIPIAI